MTLEQCNENWNYMYEWNLNGKWYPCHVFEDNSPEFVSQIAIFTSNGTISHVSPENVRKMNKDTYIINRHEIMKSLGPYYKEKGFHDMLHEDVEIWENEDLYPNNSKEELEI